MNCSALAWLPALSLSIASASALLGLQPTLLAQCGLEPVASGLPGSDRAVLASLRWDPDGPGPQAEVVVFGGLFRVVDSLPASGIATYDPNTGAWSALGSGVDGEVRCRAVLPTGELVVGGTFDHAGGQPAARVAVWNGAAWSALGSGMLGDSVDALAVLSNGDLVAGGTFTQAGGVPALNIARWDGSAWSSIASGITGPGVRALTALPNGGFAAGGSFYRAGATRAEALVLWDGTSWVSPGGGLLLASSSPTVHDLLVLPNGDLAVGGAFTSAGGMPGTGVAIWDGNSWSVLGSSFSVVTDLDLLPGGGLIAAGVGGSAAAIGVHRWLGSTWTTIGGSVGAAKVTPLPNGELLVGGAFTTVQGQSGHNLARFDGSRWLPLVDVPGSLPVPQTNLLVGRDGTVVAVASSVSAAVPSLRRWNGTDWDLLPPVAAGTTVVLADGSLLQIAGSSFLRWNGSVWAPLPSMPTVVILTAAAALRNGGLAVQGVFSNPTFAGLRLWDGVRWTDLVASSGVLAVAELPNGDLVVGGDFASIGGVAASRIARFDGAQFAPLGSGLNGRVNRLAALPDGSVVAVGTFTMAGGQPAPGLARWDGGAWLPVLSGFTPHRLAGLPNGDFLATDAQGRLARYDGSQWTLPSAFDGPVFGVAALPSGEVWVAGDFLTVGGAGSAYLARLQSTCPARAASYGAGCAGSAGVLQLQATALPWLGAVARSTGSGVAPAGLVFGVFGLAPAATPLASLHPAGGLGCSSLVQPVGAIWLPVVGGSVELAFRLPTDPALVAVELRQQLLQAELGGGGIALLSSSNGLRLVAGRL